MTEGFWKTEPIVDYLAGVPDKRLLILDLFSDSTPVYKRTYSYFGRPYVSSGFPGGWGASVLFHTLHT